MNIFCASGGGTKGSFHGGVYEALLDAGITMDALVGVSTGALIAGWMSQSLPKNDISQRQYLKSYQDIWFGLKSTRDIRKGNLWTGILRLLSGESSLYTLEPLRALALKNMPETAAPLMPTRLGIVDLQTTNFVHYIPTDRQTLLDGMIASSTIPLIAPPITLHYQNKIIVGVDGGVRTVAPVEMAITLGKQLTSTEKIHIFVSNATPVAGWVPGDLLDYINVKYWPIWKVATRSMWIQGHEIIHNDIDLAIEINKLLEYFRINGYPLPEFLENKVEVDITVINSMQDPYDTWTVDSEKIKRYWEYGRSECQRIIQQ